MIGDHTIFEIGLWIGMTVLVARVVHALVRAWRAR